MKKLSRVYIAIGSNLGNKLQNLQNAVYEIYRRVGEIAGLSRVYETESWGFTSANFYNACLAVDTALEPQEVMDMLLDIEEG